MRTGGNIHTDHLSAHDSQHRLEMARRLITLRISPSRLSFISCSGIRKHSALPAPLRLTKLQRSRRYAPVIIGGVKVPMLSLADGVCYSALYLMRHLMLRSDLYHYQPI